MAKSVRSNFLESEKLPVLESVEIMHEATTKKDHREIEMMSSSLMVETEEKQVLLSPPASKG